VTRTARTAVTSFSAAIEKSLHTFGGSRHVLRTMAEHRAVLSPLTDPDRYGFTEWVDEWEALHSAGRIPADVTALLDRTAIRNLFEITHTMRLFDAWGGADLVLDVLDAANPTWRNGYDHVAALLLLHPSAAEARQWAETGQPPSLDDALMLIALSSDTSAQHA
jgi:hypothetical protein